MTVPAPSPDYPGWIQALAEAGAFGLALWQTTRASRADWATSWARVVEELSELTSDEVMRAVEKNPVIAEAVGHAWETAIRTSAEEKRWHLAKVVAAALRNPDDHVQLEELQFLLRTVIAVEPPHLRLLLMIATPRPGTGQLAGTLVEGYLTPRDLSGSWPEADTLLDRMVTTLLHEGLIENRASGTYKNETGWGLTRYGRRFLDFLGGAEWDELRSHAYVVAYGESRGDDALLVIRNLGPAAADDITIEVETVSGTPIIRHPLPGTLLEALSNLKLPVHEDIAYMEPVEVKVSWSDSRGQHTVEAIVPLRRSGTDRE